MLEARGDIFKIDCDAVCITTNGFIKSNGENVMGKGCAKQASTMLPWLPKFLGDCIKKYGNCVNYLYKQNGVNLLSFPVKPKGVFYDGNNVVKHMMGKFNIGDTVPGWAAVADPRIIEQSARELLAIADEHEWKSVVLPRPGCGAGELSWDDVKPLLDRILDDRFTCVTF